jgi:outer membrane lipoprotein SlyB
MKKTALVVGLLALAASLTACDPSTTATGKTCHESAAEQIPGTVSFNSDERSWHDAQTNTIGILGGAITSDGTTHMFGCTLDSDGKLVDDAIML